jgi:hypothetical protein
MKLRVTSDGTVGGTRVTNAATGEEVDGVDQVSFAIDARSRGRLLIRVLDWEGDVQASAAVERRLPDVSTPAPRKSWWYRLQHWLDRPHRNWGEIS